MSRGPRFSKVKTSIDLNFKNVNLLCTHDHSPKRNGWPVGCSKVLQQSHLDLKAKSPLWGVSNAVSFPSVRRGSIILWQTLHSSNANELIQGERTPSPLLLQGVVLPWLESAGCQGVWVTLRGAHSHTRIQAPFFWLWRIWDQGPTVGAPILFIQLMKDLEMEMLLFLHKAWMSHTVRTRGNPHGLGPEQGRTSCIRKGQFSPACTLGCPIIPWNWGQVPLQALMCLN